MVDLRELKAGDIIVFKNGKRAEFFQYEIYCERGELTMSLNYKVVGDSLKTWDEYNVDGTRMKPYIETSMKLSDDYNIVEIISKEDEEVNLNELKYGDFIKFRNGTLDKPKSLKKVMTSAGLCYHITTDSISTIFYINGRLSKDGTEHDYDIVDIIPKEQAMTEQAEDKVNHPSHYISGGIECIEAIKASMSKDEYNGYLKGNVLKYVWRYKNKNNPAEDLKKAKVYLEWLIKEVEDVGTK